MIYYYFGGKEQLYVAELTFDHHEAHPDFIRLVTIENIHRAEHIARSKILAGLANPALDVLSRILARGRAAGQFRDGVDPIDIHLLISAFCDVAVAYLTTRSGVTR